MAVKCGGGWQNACAPLARPGCAALERNVVPLVWTTADHLVYRWGGLARLAVAVTPTCGFLQLKQPQHNHVPDSQLTTGAFMLSDNQCVTEQPKRGHSEGAVVTHSKNVFGDALCRLHTKESSFFFVFKGRLCQELPRTTYTLPVLGLLASPEPVVHAQFHVDGKNESMKGKRSKINSNKTKV